MCVRERERERERQRFAWCLFSMYITFITVEIADKEHTFPFIKWYFSALKVLLSPDTEACFYMPQVSEVCGA